MMEGLAAHPDGSNGCATEARVGRAPAGSRASRNVATVHDAEKRQACGPMGCIPAE